MHRPPSTPHAARALATARPSSPYIADEAHRFVTSDPAHGEQSLMDAGSRSSTGSDGHMEMLLASTATKLFFRSTQAARHPASMQISGTGNGGGRLWGRGAVAALHGISASWRPDVKPGRPGHDLRSHRDPVVVRTTVTHELEHHKLGQPQYHFG